MARRPPNLLILMADQMTPFALPPYGHKLVHAPFIAELAAEGVVFDAAYCNSPLCGPSRAALMSGLLPSATGAYDNAAPFSPEIPTFAHHLRALGYLTVLTGKMHFCGSDQLHGFEERLTTDIYPADFGWTPDWEHPELRPSWYHNMSSVIDAGPCVRTNQLDFDEEVVFTAERRIYDLVRASDGRPFCLVVSLTHPHDPFAIPQRFWDLYEGVAIDPPRVTPSPGALDPHSRRLRFVCAMDETPVTEAQVLRARRAYYGAISYVDEQFARVVTTLRNCGLADDTIIILLSDHGEMLGEHGLWYKMSFREGSARIPLIVHAPRRFSPRRVPQAVAAIDLLPTLVGLGGGTVGSIRTDGSNLEPHLRGDPGHDVVFGEYLAEGVIAPMLMIRRGLFKFIHTPGDPDQLFNVEDDPLEITNLVQDPNQKARVAAFREEIGRRWDIALLHRQVLESQRRRRLIDTAQRRGQWHGWDWQPPRDATREYIRSHMDLDDLEAKARLPAVKPHPPASR
jgi:choline-sulfatase